MSPRLKSALHSGAGTLDVGGADQPLTATKFVRFRDLKERRIVQNWPTLLRWIQTEGFPPGVRLGPNLRAWAEPEVDAWLKSRRIPFPHQHGEAALK
jgi:predicted DNA-binding transcriptional regulator AlpA